MIDLYHAPTPNGHKLTLFLEETGLPYRLIPVKLSRGEQFRPEFLAISPNNKIPALVDHAPADGGPPVSMFESGAMLLYLADKTGLLVPRDARLRNEAIQWLFWQVGGLGPMAGQIGHFNVYRWAGKMLTDAELVRRRGRFRGSWPSTFRAARPGGA